MNFKHALVWSFTFAGLPLAYGSSVNAALPHYTSNSSNTDSKYQSPEDMISMIPFLGSLPRSFIFGNGYKIKLGKSDLRIDHRGTNSRAPANARTCSVGVSYVTPVAGFFTSKFEIPLLYSPDLALADWSHSSLGDYIASFSRGADDHASIRLVVSAKF